MKNGENIFKRKDGRWEARYIKGYELSGKIKYGFVTVKPTRRQKKKLQNTRWLCLQANRHRRPAHDIALLFTATNGCACEKAKYGNPPTSSMIRFWKSIFTTSL